MTEYIKKEDALAHPFANGHYDKANANRDFIRGHESYKEWLEDLPVADVRENVRGEWIKCDYLVDNLYLLDENEYYLCNKCHQKLRKAHNYCPNCGADMRGGDAE